MKLTAIIYPDSETDLLVAECPKIGTSSQGHTEAETLANLQEATDFSYDDTSRYGVTPRIIQPATLR